MYSPGLARTLSISSASEPTDAVFLFSGFTMRMNGKEAISETGSKSFSTSYCGLRDSSGVTVIMLALLIRTV